MQLSKYIPVLAGLALLAHSTGQCALVARWSFNDSSGGVAHDSVGNLHGNLSPQGSSFVGGGVSGNAVNLNRSLNGYVRMGNVLGFTNQPFSVVSWVKTAPGYSIGDSQVFSKHIGFSQNGYWMILNTTGGGGQTGKALFGEGTAAISVLSTQTVTDGNWHQIVTTWQPGVRLAIYVDGAPVENTRPASASLIPNNAAFIIGGVILGTVPEGRLTGLVDEVQVYDHALTPEQVDFLFANPTNIVTDCAEVLAATQNQLGTVQFQLAATQLQLANAQAELASANSNLVQLQNQIDQGISLLTLDFRETFRDPRFGIPGDEPIDQFESLLMTIGDLNLGFRRGIYFAITGRSPVR